MTEMESLTLLLNELESTRLEVCLVPLNPRGRGYNEGGCKRVAVSRNANWYRAFCAQFPSSRGVRRGGFDTRIRRANVIRQLQGLIDGRYAGKYREAILSVATGRITK